MRGLNVAELSFMALCGHGQGDDCVGRARTAMCRGSGIAHAMISVRLDNRIRLAGELTEAMLEELQARFTYDNPRYRDLRQRDTQPPTIRTWRGHRNPGSGLEVSFPRGGLGRIRDVLTQMGLRGRDVALVDARTWENPVEGFPDHRKPLWPHQVPLVQAAEQRETCLLKAPTGSGKSTAALALAARLKRRSLIMVWTGNLLQQWRERAIEELGYDENGVGVLGLGRFELKPLTIGMQQTIYSRLQRGDDELSTAFDVVVCDEVQRYGADTLVETIDPFAARYRIGVSADHSRHDELDFLITDLFGEVAASVSEAELVSSGVVVDVEVAVMPTTFKAPWYRYRQDFNRLLAAMTADEERNGIILMLARNAVATGEQVLLFTHRVEHARDLDRMLVSMGIPSGTLLGGVDNATAFERTKDGLKRGDFKAAVGTYQAIAQGLDLPSVSRGICCTPIGNNRQQFGQVRGRICRRSEGKRFGRLGYLLDTGIYYAKPIRNFLQWGHAVKVWDGAAWVEGATFLDRMRKRGIGGGHVGTTQTQ